MLFIYCLYHQFLLTFQDCGVFLKAKVDQWSLPRVSTLIKESPCFAVAKYNALHFAVRHAVSTNKVWFVLKETKCVYLGILTVTHLSIFEPRWWVDPDSVGDNFKLIIIFLRVLKKIPGRLPAAQQRLSNPKSRDAEQVLRFMGGTGSSALSMIWDSIL